MSHLSWFLFTFTAGKLRTKFCAQLRRLPLAELLCLIEYYHHLSIWLKSEILDNILEFSVLVAITHPGDFSFEISLSISLPLICLLLSFHAWIAQIA